MYYNGNNQVKCECGTDFGVSARSYDDSVNTQNNKKCDLSCSASGTHGCDPTTQRCCGDANFQIYPVYANPRLMGCHIPRIPGYYQIEANGGPATPIQNSYSCIATPYSLSSRRSSSVAYASTVGTVTRSASFVGTATATRGASTLSYVQYGCYDGAVSSALSYNGAVATVEASVTNVDVDKCVQYCASQSKDWAAVGGSRSSTRCVCGSTFGTGSGPIAMDYCNEPCQNPAVAQNCGDANRFMAYAVAASATGGQWYQAWSSSITTRLVRITRSFQGQTCSL
ncbi:hypothetical protein PFICI_01046 [Pestalotiopsis fici W106-1]|uniref:WSC domain-containing protein n=1 Tax=Pestalotiopsis fici (strain W106-1 / CGMCC3.15140) TaxID=1229662 RepID=W3XMF7_PESFW|nr:uncharacterized protein PFICI_01046 [Pestalotiopsis fici W106-1]ETS87218.1 hypothetical protein PFICI_01046 [Pestalotiopsis fici W106-1]